VDGAPAGAWQAAVGLYNLDRKSLAVAGGSGFRRWNRSKRWNTTRPLRPVRRGRCCHPW